MVKNEIMKKLFYILLFFVSCNTEFVYSQININNTFAQTFNTSNTPSFTITSYTYLANHLYILFILSTKATTPDIPTVTTTGLTWVQVSTVTCGTIASPTNRVTLFRCMPTSNTTASTDVNYAGNTQDGIGAFGYEITGMVTTGTNGDDAIIQSVTSNADASANPSITMSSLNVDGRNAVIACFTNSLNPFDGTPESGWTELFDNGYNTPTTGAYTMNRYLTTDNTPTVTASSSDWAGIAIEIKSAARRRIIVD